MYNFKKYFFISLIFWLATEWLTVFNPDFERWKSYWPQIWIFYIGYPLLFSYLIYKRNWSSKKIFIAMIFFGGFLFELLFFKNINLIKPPLAFIFLPAFIAIYSLITFVPKWIVEGKVMENKKKIILMLIVLILISLATYKNNIKKNIYSCGDFNKLKEVNVEIDANKNLGEMPEIFNGGFFAGEFLWSMWEDGNKDKLNYHNKKIFSELYSGMTTITIPLASENFDDFKDKVKNKKYLDSRIDYIKKIEENGGTALIDFQFMPIWLSGKPENIEGEYWRFPPKDYEKWKELINYSVAYLKEKGITGASYRVWEEADLDNFWKGTDEEFYKLYKYTAEAIKSADKDAKITFGQVLAEENQDKFFKNILAFIKENNLPLDYIIFHPFGHIPDSKLYQEESKKINSLVRVAGFNKEIPLYAESWNSWLLYGRPNLKNEMADERSPERDTEYNAAYIASNLYAMDAGGIKYQTFFSDYDSAFGSLSENGAVNFNQQFYGDFGIFSKDLIIKPSYNAFKVLSILSGKTENERAERLSANFEEDKITAISSIRKDRKKIRILLSNFNCARKNVNLNIGNINFAGKANFIKYTIDKDHANSCRYNYRNAKNKSVPCGIGGSIDKIISEGGLAEEINNRGEVSLEGSKEVKEITISSNNTFNEKIIMEPFSIKLLEVAKIID